jgi:hypothetical protein
MEAKMATMKPIKPGDVHIMINDWEKVFIGEAKAYDASGKVLWTIPALCKGASGARWQARNGDTPPGLYLAGELFVTQANESTQTWNAYGKHCIDLIEQENQERKYERGGICWHGGGTGAPDPLAPYQPLLVTLGCVRSHNNDLAKTVVPLLQSLTAKGNRMWITVNQFD